MKTKIPFPVYHHALIKGLLLCSVLWLLLVSCPVLADEQAAGGKPATLLAEAPKVALTQDSVSSPSFVISPNNNSGSLLQEKLSVDRVEVRPSQDKPSSYLFSLPEAHGADPFVGFATVDRIDLTQFKKETQSQYRGEFLFGYNMSTLGSILFGRAMQFERPGGDTTFKLQDDGWRFKFLKRF